MMEEIGNNHLGCIKQDENLWHSPSRQVFSGFFPSSVCWRIFTIPSYLERRAPTKVPLLQRIQRPRFQAFKGGLGFWRRFDSFRESRTRLHVEPGWSFTNELLALLRSLYWGYKFRLIMRYFAKLADIERDVFLSEFRFFFKIGHQICIHLYFLRTGKRDGYRGRSPDEHTPTSSFLASHFSNSH